MLGWLDPDEYDAVARAAADRLKAREWQHAEELLALILEQLGIMHAAMVKLWAKEGTKAPKPVRYPRPSDPPKQKPRAATRAEIAARIPLRSV